MSLNFKHKSGKLFRRLLASVICLIMIPTIIFTAFYSTSITRYLEEEISKAHLNHLKLYQSNIDKLLGEAKKNALFLSLEPQLEELMLLQNNKQHTSYDYLETVLDIRTLLSSFLVTDDFIHSVYVYNTDTGDILNSSSSTAESNNIQEFFDTGWLPDIENLHTFKLLPKRQPINTGFNGYMIDIDRDVRSNVMTLLCPVKIVTDPNITAVIVINLYARSFELDNVHDGLIMVNDDGDIIHGNTTLQELIPSDLAIDYEHPNGTFKTQMDKNSFLVTYQYSYAHGITYYKFSNTEDIFNTLNKYKLIILMITFLMIAFGIMASFFIAKTFYSPIKSTLDILDTHLNLKISGRNELTLIKEAVDAIIQRDNKIHENLQTHEDQLAKNNLLQLLRGNTDIASSAFIAKNSSICCLVLSIDNYADFANQHAYKNQYYFKSLLLKLGENSISKYAKGNGVLLEQDKIGIIIEMPSHEPNEYERILENIAWDLREELANIDNFSATLCFGQCHDHIERLRDSYLEGLEALRYRMTYGYGSTIYYHQLPLSHGQLHPSLAPLHVNPLMNHLKAHQLDAINDTLDQFINTLKNSSIVTTDGIMDVLYPLITETYSYLHEIDVSPTEVFEEHGTIYKILSDCETLDDIKHHLFTFFEKILQCQLSKEEEVSQVDLTLKYLHEHYWDRTLDLTSLSEKMGVSYSHLRKLLKDKTGMSYIQYLNSIRICKAKELLADTPFTIKDISIKIGYNNDQSFTRYFKKFEGITPGEYRRKNCTL